MNRSQSFFNPSKRVLTFALTIILWPLLVSAQVYKSVDETGKVTFSDQPKAQSEAIELTTPNTLPAVTAVDAETSLGVIESVVDYSNVSITNPPNNSIIANGLIPFSVSATSNPALDQGHTMQLKIDGKVHSTGKGSFAIDSIQRGEHQFQVVIIDQDGEALLQSKPVKVFVYRPGR